MREGGGSKNDVPGMKIWNIFHAQARQGRTHGKMRGSKRWDIPSYIFFKYKRSKLDWKLKSKALNRMLFLTPENAIILDFSLQKSNMQFNIWTAFKMSTLQAMQHTCSFWRYKKRSYFHTKTAPMSPCRRSTPILNKTSLSCLFLFRDLFKQTDIWNKEAGFIRKAGFP